jgi:peptide/nickel transport system permease protein
VAARQDPPSVVPAGTGLVRDFGAEGELPSGETEVVARGFWEQIWRRLRQDRLALASGIFIVLLVLVAYAGAPIAAYLLGHGPDTIIPGGVDPETFIPVGPWSTVKGPDGEPTLLILGASDTLGRDEFLRLLYGARASLEVSVLATLFGTALGVVTGLLAGFYRGGVDTIVSRLTEIVMAFPLLLLAIALASTVGDRMNSVTLGIFTPGVLTLVVVFTVFGWFYPARIIRAQVLALREKEFVEAARMVGASNARIMRSHILPHLVAPIVVVATLNIALLILAEASLSFLGVGIPLPNPSWGNLLDSSIQFYTVQPWLILWPGLALLFATLAFNLLGDGLRDAFDPRSSRR